MRGMGNSGFQTPQAPGILSQVGQGLQNFGNTLTEGVQAGLNYGSIPLNFAAGVTGLPIGYTTQQMRDTMDAAAKASTRIGPEGGEYVGYEDLGAIEGPDGQFLVPDDSQYVPPTEAESMMPTLMPMQPGSSGMGNLLPDLYEKVIQQPTQPGGPADDMIFRKQPVDDGSSLVDRDPNLVERELNPPSGGMDFSMPGYSDPLPQDQLMLGFEEYVRNNPYSGAGTAAIIPAILPGGYKYNFSGSQEANKFNDYLESIGQAPYQGAARPIESIDGSKLITSADYPEDYKGAMLSSLASSGMGNLLPDLYEKVIQQPTPEGTLPPINLDDFEPQNRIDAPTAPLDNEPIPQNQLMSGFAEWKRNNPDKVSNTGTAAMSYMTLPNGEPITFSGGAEANNMRQYLESIGQAPMTRTNLYRGDQKPIGGNLNRMLSSLASGGIARMLGE